MAWGKRKDGRPQRSWTDEDKAELLRLRNYRGLGWVPISEHFPGSTPMGCRSAYADARNAIAKKSAADKVAQRTGVQAVDDRNRRRSLLDARTDITANFFGDPPPGYSALDGYEAPRVSDRRAVQQPAKPTLYWGRLKPEGIRA